MGVVCAIPVKNLILVLGLTHQWFLDKQKLFATSQIMQGKSSLITIQKKLFIQYSFLLMLQNIRCCKDCHEG